MKSFRAFSQPQEATPYLPYENLMTFLTFHSAVSSPSNTITAIMRSVKSHLYCSRFFLLFLFVCVCLQAASFTHRKNKRIKVKILHLSVFTNKCKTVTRVMESVQFLLYYSRLVSFVSVCGPMWHPSCINNTKKISLQFSNEFRILTPI